MTLNIEEIGFYGSIIGVVLAQIISYVKFKVDFYYHKEELKELKDKVENNELITNEIKTDFKYISQSIEDFKTSLDKLTNKVDKLFKPE